MDYGCVHIARLESQLEIPDNQVGAENSKGPKARTRPWCDGGLNRTGFAKHSGERASNGAPSVMPERGR